ncbi:transglutaminaseTgpA domain-containing protein [Streptomyces sp. NPDC092296]|uniref:transglutaminase family protein n=1 Tax=Streptomyces sp. NPDC092296 TaxID=3366012 RepID=UPI003830E926
MTGRTRLTLCSAAAVMLVAFCLVPLLSSAGWLLHAAVLVVATAGAGALVRRLPLPRSLAPVVQLLVLAYLLLLDFVRGAQLAGVIPGPATLDQLVRLLRSGLDDINSYGTPAPDTPGLRLILVGSVALVALIVDTLAVTYRRAALAGLPLLALYSVGTGLGDGDLAWLWFLLAAGGYLTVLYAEGQDRLSRWGRVFQGAGRFGGGSAPLTRGGHRIGVLALAVALLVPLLLPKLGDGILGRELGHHGGGGGTITAVNPVVSLQSDLNRPDNIEQLRYTTTSKHAGDMYLRIGVSDDFNGVDWKPSQQKVEDVPSVLPQPAGLSTATPRADVSTRIVIGGHLSQDWLPMPYPASAVDVPGDWRFEPGSRTLVGDKGQKTLGLTYTVRSLDVEPTAEQLRAAPVAPEDIRARYLRLPADLPAVVRSTALAVTRDAATPYDKAVALQNWFATSGEFSYNTEVRAGTGSNAIVQFLQDKQGFCVHFSATMAAMARVLGIPARVAVGFTSGTQQFDGSWAVGTKDAHAWPELYFEGAGWLRFEPTPARGTAPAYTEQEQKTGPDGTEQQPTPEPTVRPTAAPSPDTSCAADGCDSPQTTVQVAVERKSSWPAVGVLVGIGAGVLLVVLLLIPMLWRARQRRVRLRPAAGGGSGPVELTDAQVLAAWQELVDSAWDLGIAPDEAETPRRTVSRITTVAGLDGEPLEAAGRVALATERMLYARTSGASARLGSDVRTASEGLRASVGRWVRVRAVLLPPSSVRLAWRLADGLEAGRTAVRGALWAVRRRVVAGAGRLRRGRGRG